MQLLTHSRQAAFKICRKRHWFAYELGIRRVTDGKALRMGTAYHVGLETMAVSGELQSSLDAASERYRLAPDEFDQWEWDIEETTVRALLSGYFWRWSESLEYLATEQVFNLRIKNPATNRSVPGWQWSGKIDGIVVLEDGRLAVKENKLLSDDLTSDSEFWRRLQMDPQVSGYVVAGRELGYDVATVLYDVTRKPTIKPTPIPILDDDGQQVVIDIDENRVFTKNGKPRQTADAKLGYRLVTRPMTVEEWGDRLVNDIASRPDYYYARREIPRLDKDLEEWRAEMYEVQRTIGEAQKANRWYKTVSRDTCGMCPYFGLCFSGFDPASDSLPEGFVRVEDVHPELETQNVNRSPAGTEAATARR